MISEQIASPYKTSIKIKDNSRIPLSMILSKMNAHLKHKKKPKDNSFTRIEPLSPSNNRKQQDSFPMNQFKNKKLSRRIFSPQNTVLRSRVTRNKMNTINYMNLPDFDRGKRKISKMGGFPQMMFMSGKKKTSEKLETVQSPVAPNRRFTSASPNIQNRFKTPIMKKQTYNVNKINKLENSNSNKANVKQNNDSFIFEIIPEEKKKPKFKF